MKTLVAGVDGFIGSHVVETLQKQGHQIRALALYHRDNHWGWLENLNSLESIEVIMSDLLHTICSTDRHRSAMANTESTYKTHTLRSTTTVL